MVLDRAGHTVALGEVYLIAGKVRRIEGSTDLLVVIGGDNGLALRVAPGDVCQVDDALAGGVSDGDKGDVTVSGGGTSWTIDAGVVSTTKLGGDITAAGKALLDDADAAAQRSTLGLVIGTNVQAYDAELAAIAGLVSAADRVPYFTGSGTAALATFTSFGRNLVDDADAAAGRTTLGLGTVATENVVPISKGGTGQTSQAAAFASLAPTPAGNGPISYDAFSSTWVHVDLTGLSDGDILQVEAGAPGGITTRTLGALADLNTVNNAQWSGTDLAVANGGTGASDAATARSNLGLVIGTNVQAYDAELAAIAGLVSAADRVPYFTGSGTAALATFTSFGRSLVDDADAAAGRTTLGAAASGAATASGLTVSATDRLLGRQTAGSGAVEEITCTAAGRALIDDADAAAQRTTLSAARQLSEQFVEWFDDLDAPTMTWFATTTGTGASASTGTDHVNATENAIGEVVLALGTTASSRAGIYKQADGILLGTAAFTLEWRGTVGALSTAADEFVLHWGFIDNPTSNAEPTNGAYFRYSRAADGDFWVCVTRDNGTETKTVTAISPADYSTLHTFSIEVNAAGSSVVFKRNGSTLATHATNIPTAAGRRTGLGFRGYRTAYTATGRWSYIDWVRYTATRTSAR